MTVTCRSSSARCCSIASISRVPVTDSLATTRRCISARPSAEGASVDRHRFLGALALGGTGENGVARARSAVLVRTADDLRKLAEVEDGRRRGHLPFEWHCPPRVRDCPPPPPPR